MPSYLTRVGGRRVLNASASTALKPRSLGGRTLVLTSNLSDPEILVASGRPGRGNVPLRVYTGAPPVIAPPTLPTDPSQITWEGALATLTGGTSGSAVTFNARNFRSLSAATPAVLLDNYSGTVTFTNCNFFGYGQPGTAKGIIGSTYGARVYFVNCAFFSGNPLVTGQYPGQIRMDGFKEVSIINCDFYGTGGIYLNDWKGTAGQAGDTVTIRNNRFYNIDGRISNTANSDKWGHGNVEGTDKHQTQMVQMNLCIGMPKVLIQDNLCINEPGKSRVEDIVSTYKSSGTSTSPMIINRNCFDGQHIYDHAFDAATSVYYGNNMATSLWQNSSDARGMQPSGGGGLAGDGGGATYLQDSAWIRYTNNTVLGMSNYGLGIAAAHDCLLDGNTILRSGYVRGITARDVAIAWRHVPIQIQDYNLGGGTAVDDGTGTSTNRVRWYNNDVTNNTFGYTAYDPRSAGAKGNDNMLVNSPLRTNTGNTRVLDVTRAQEDAAYTAHLNLWVAQGQTIGRTS